MRGTIRAGRLTRTPYTSITPQELPAYPCPATPTSSCSLTHRAPSNPPRRLVVPPCASLGVRMDSTWTTTLGPPSSGRTAHPGGRHQHHTATHNNPAPQNLGLVYSTVDIHLTKRLAELPLHRAIESVLTTQSLGLRIAFRVMQAQYALHIVKRESSRYTYGNKRADTQAEHQITNHTQVLKHVRLETTHHSQRQHLPPRPSPTQPAHCIPEDTPSTDGDKQYHYPTPIQQLATTLDQPANTELCDAPRTPSVTPSTTQPFARIASQHTCKNSTPTCARVTATPHPILPMVRTPLHPCSRGVQQMHLRPHRGQNLGPLQDVPTIPELDTRTYWNPTHTIAEPAGWPSWSPATQNFTTILRQVGVPKAVRQGLVPPCRLHPATHPRRRPPSHGSALATDSSQQNSRATQVPHPQVPAAGSHPTPAGPGQSLQTPVPPTERPHPATDHQTQNPPFKPAHNPPRTTPLRHA